MKILGAPRNGELRTMAGLQGGSAGVTSSSRDHTKVVFFMELWGKAFEMGKNLGQITVILVKSHKLCSVAN